MTIQQMIDSHRKAEEAQRKQAEAHRENDLKRIEQIINKQLGSMADELEVEKTVGTLTEDGCAYSSLVLTVRVKSWEPGVHTFEILWRGTGHFGGKPSGPVAFRKGESVGRYIVIAPESMDQVAAFLSDEQAEYDERLSKAQARREAERRSTIATLSKKFSWGSSTYGNEQLARQGLDQLIELKPDREKEWRSLFDGWKETKRARQEKAAEQEAQEKLAEERMSAYLAAHKQWSESHDNIIEENQERLAQLQQEHDSTFLTWTLTYSIPGGPEHDPTTESVEILGKRRSFPADWTRSWPVVDPYGNVTDTRFFTAVHATAETERSVSAGSYVPSLRVYEAGHDKFFFSHDEDPDEIKAEIAKVMKPLPERPKPADFHLSPEDGEHALLRAGYLNFF